MTIYRTCSGYIESVRPGFIPTILINKCVPETQFSWTFLWNIAQEYNHMYSAER